MQRIARSSASRINIISLKAAISTFALQSREKSQRQAWCSCKLIRGIEHNWMVYV